MQNVYNMPVRNSVVRQRRLLDLGVSIAVFIFAIILYANTFGHGWVLDDRFLFQDNKFVTAGVSGFGKILSDHSQAGAGLLPETFQYRPVSQLLFAVEWEMSPDNTVLYHTMNVLWNAMCSVVLFLLLRMIFKRRTWVFSLVITLIFTANPMHTEVVANIKSRDELCYFMFLLLAIISALKYYSNAKKINLLWLFLSYTAAFFSKESAITGLVAVPLFVFFFGEQETSQSKVKAFANIFCVLVVSAGIYLTTRCLVLSVWHDYHSSYVTLMQNYLADQPWDIRIGSAVWLMGKYLLLAFVPYMQACDYSYAQLPYVGLLDWRAIVVLLLYMILVVYVIYSLLVKKEKSVFSFCILFWLTTMSIYSNTIYLIGASFADRFLFVPILASSIVIVELLAKILKLDTANCPKGAKSLTMIVLCMLIVGVFSAKTVLRAADWKDQYTLYKADIQNVSGSARMNFYYADAVRDKALLSEGVDDIAFGSEMKKAISLYNNALGIHPDYGECYERLGFCYLRLNAHFPGMHYADSSTYYLDKSIELLRYNELAYYNRAEAAFAFGDYVKAKECYLEVLDIGKNVYDSYFKLANSYYELGVYDTAVMYYQRELERDSSRSEIYYNIGVCYSNISKSESCEKDSSLSCVEKSVEMYDKAIGAHPELYVAYIAKIKSLMALGSWNEALDCGLKAVEVDPKAEDGYFYVAVACFNLSKFDDSEYYFNKVVEINPNNFSAYYNLARVYAMRGEMSTAMEMQSKAAELQSRQNNLAK